MGREKADQATISHSTGTVPTEFLVVANSSAVKGTTSASLNKTPTHSRQCLLAHGKLKAITLRRAIAISFVHVFFRNS